jgi:hypothetical protein
MHFLRKIRSLLGLNFAEQANKEIAQEEEQAARKVAMRFSRGSVGIQSGAFLTRKELDRKIEGAE